MDHHLRSHAFAAVGDDLAQGVGAHILDVGLVSPRAARLHGGNEGRALVRGETRANEQAAVIVPGPFHVPPLVVGALSVNSFRPSVEASDGLDL